jgi:hypothetical protein
LLYFEFFSIIILTRSFACEINIVIIESVYPIVSSKVRILNEYNEIVPKASQGATDKGHPGKEAKEESAKNRRGRLNTYERPNVC